MQLEKKKKRHLPVLVHTSPDIKENDISMCLLVENSDFSVHETRTSNADI